MKDSTNFEATWEPVVGALDYIVRYESTGTPPAFSKYKTAQTTVTFSEPNNGGVNPNEICAPARASVQAVLPTCTSPTSNYIIVLNPTCAK